MKITLKDVTLICIDTVCHDLTALAVNECLSKCDFEDVQLYSDKKLSVPGVGTIDFEQGASSTQVWRFLWYKIPFLVKTSHFLIIQWDSWVLKQAKWTNDFLQYDYIGAPWNYNDGFDVGNGGFCLRSVNLTEYVAENPDLYPYGEHEDQVLCRGHAPALQAGGFKWAPKNVATEFSFEWVWEDRGGHFGFHDPRNFPKVLPLGEVAERIKMMEKIPYIAQKGVIDRTRALMHELGQRCGYLSLG